MARSNTANGGTSFYDLDIQYISGDVTGYNLRAVIYLTSRPVTDGTNSLNVGGHWSRSGVLTLGGSYDHSPVWFQDITVPRQYGQDTLVSVNASWVNVEYWGATLSAVEYYIVPARPWELPVPPDNITASRNSDVSHSISWSNHTSGVAPYEGQRMFRSTDGAGWELIQNIGPNDTVFTDNTTSADHTYQWHLQAYNSSGTTSGGVSNAISTTPTAPTYMTAAKSGTNVVLTWDKPSRLTAGCWWEVLHLIDLPGYSWETIGTPGIEARTLTHTAPDPSKPHRYAVRQVSTTGATTWSGYAYSNTVQLFNVPAAPTAFAVARNSDTSQTLTWVNHPTTSAPYDNMRVYRMVTAGTGYGSSWALIATLAGTAQSYTDTTTSADHAYVYSLHAVNSAGWTSVAANVPMQTTPFAPSGATAVKNASNNIVVSWLSNTALTNTTWTIERSDDNGATWVAQASGIAMTTTSYTHTGPDILLPHRYRVKSVSVVGAPTSSAWATTADVNIAAPPNAPTDMAPTAIRDASDPAILTWKHNPVDSSPQSGFQLRHRAQGNATWTTVTVASAASSWVLPADTYANPVTVEWQVATKGAHASYSPWSATVASPTSTRPTTTISQPEDGDPWLSSQLVAEWAYYDAESTPQIAWEASLYASDGTTLVEQRSGAGDASLAAFQTKLPDSTNWVIKVRTRDSSGLWSNLMVRPFAVSYALPVKPIITFLTWDPDTASVQVQFSNGDPGEDDAVTIHNDVYRRRDGGEWELIATKVPLNTSVTDWAPSVTGTNEYRVDAFSALPSLNQSDVGAVTLPKPGDVPSVWLSGGPGFSVVCRAVHNTVVDASGERVKQLRRYAGRTLPMEHAGKGQETSWAISTDIIQDSAGPTSSPADAWLQLATYAGPFLLRTPDGLYRYVSVGRIQVRRGVGGTVAGVVFQATEVGR